MAALRRGKLGEFGHLALYAAFRARYARRFGRIDLAGDERLIYLHSFEYYDALAEQARRLGVRIIYDAHDYYQGIVPDHSRYTFDSKHLMPFLRRREAACVAGADAVFTVSHGAADLIEREYGRRPLVLRNGHDTRLDLPPKTDLRARLGLGPDPTIVVVVGNYKAGMAFDGAIDALDILPKSVHFVFVGRGYSPAMVPPRLQRRLHVDIVVPPRQVVPLIASADIGLVAYRPISSNYRYALPNGFFQVVAAGLPVIYPMLPEIAATVADYRIGVGLYDVSGRSIAEGVRRVLARTSECRQASRKLAAEIGWERDEMVLARVTEQLLASSR